MVNIIKALGLDLDKKTNRLKFDKNKLRYGKIIMCCDADPDGEAIKNLLLTYFWEMCPELLVEGYIYAAVPPLFRITTKKNEYIYLKDLKELNEYKDQHGDSEYSINRNKGLGEQNPEELEECLLNPETRNIMQICVEDVEAASTLFEILMGKQVAPRKEFLLKHAEEANV